MKKIAFATCTTLHGLPPEKSAEIMQPYVASAGIELATHQWDDIRVNWSDFDAVILRSTWDYHIRLPEFLVWIMSLENEHIPLWNPPDAVRWNSIKTYLRDLAAKNISIVPTVFLDAGTKVDLSEIMMREKWHEAVIKPMVAASAYNTWHVSSDNTAESQSRLESLLTENGMLIQRYMPEITSEGEWSLVYFRDAFGKITFSHAIVKHPAPGDMRVQSEYGGTVSPKQPSDDLLAQAQKLLDAIPYIWLYARVDGIYTEKQFYLMELELIEPDLFLGYHPDAPKHFANALVSVV